MQEEKKVMKALPLWKPECSAKFNSGMMFNAPFIVTQVQQRSDLGLCIISTRSPHYVAKIRAFKTAPGYKDGKDGYNQKQADLAQKNETERQEWLNIRAAANANGIEAEREGKSVKDYVSENRVYDEEFDEPRLVAKVPGMNVYLELYGCLDSVTDAEWDGPYGAIDTLNKMSTWAQNIWDRHDRRPRATSFNDVQPLLEWYEDYDETLRPFMPQKKGIGVWPDIDPSRRSELLYSKAPSFDNADLDMIRTMKAETARLAANGIKRPTE